MPHTGALVLAWMYLENNGNLQTMHKFDKGGTVGKLAKYVFLPLSIVLTVSFGAWLGAAIVHQRILK